MNRKIQRITSSPAADMKTTSRTSREKAGFMINEEILERAETVTDVHTNTHTLIITGLSCVPPPNHHHDLDRYYRVLYDICTKQTQK